MKWWKIISAICLLLVVSLPALHATELGDFPHTFGNMQKVLAGDTIAVIATKSDITSGATQDSDTTSWLATHTWVITNFQEDSDTSGFDATKTWVTANSQQDGDTSSWDATRTLVNSRGGLASIVSNVTVANTTTETQLIGFTIPTASLTAGMVFRIEAGGFAGDTAAYPTMTWRVRMGTSTLTGAILDSVTVITNGVVTNQAWIFNGFGTIRTIGSSGAAIASASARRYVINSVLQSLLGGTVKTPVTVDCTIDNILEVTFQWSAAHAKNTLSCYNAVIEIVKP